jgi:uncharacterized DUF497 family protein
MPYTWDESKNRRNIELHRVSFKVAVRIFEGPILEAEDDRFDYGEVRVKAIGMVDHRTVVVVFTDRGRNERRIVSARKADSTEAQAYFEAIYRR